MNTSGTQMNTSRTQVEHKRTQVNTSRTQVNTIRKEVEHKWNTNGTQVEKNENKRNQMKN